jgi:hypothetical protein
MFEPMAITDDEQRFLKMLSLKYLIDDVIHLRNVNCFVNSESLFKVRCVPVKDYSTTKEAFSFAWFLFFVCGSLYA